MRRYVPILIAGGALIAAACRDTVTPPVQATTFERLAGQSFSINAPVGEAANAKTATFVIERGGNSVRIGEFTLTFAADAVCALDSGYGEDFWKQSCVPIGRGFDVTATIFTQDGRSFVEFEPDIRFNPERVVTISVQRPEIIGVRLNETKQREYDLWYTKRIGNSRLFVDEAWRDPTLQTHFNTQTGQVWRRIEHFSGFVIRTGYCSENPSDPSCVGGEQQ